MRIRNIALVLLLMLGCAACVQPQMSLPQDQKDSAALLVAVLPLQNLTSYPNAGRIVGDLLTTSFYTHGSFKVMEQASILTKLHAMNDETDMAIDRVVALEVGKSLGVDAVVFGSVSEFRYKRGLDEDPVVGVNLRMLNVAGNTIVWAGSRSKTGGCFGFCQDSLTSLAQQVCHDLVASIHQP